MFNRFLDHPLKGNFRVSSKFGYRVHPVTGAQGSFHNGTDFAAPTGTPIYAPADGTVSNVYTHDKGGKTVIIEHDNGYRTGYAHLHTYSVKKGDKVKRGQKFAEVGNTGASTGPHLHFTVRYKGDLQDPEKVLSEKKNG
jgi:murein DD-endopeptidase MepM/ murein hydrolase activator NlpD